MAQGFAKKTTDLTSADITDYDKWNFVYQGRLTPTSGTPVITSDVTGVTTIYFTPYKGNRIALYDTTRNLWLHREFSEKSLSVPATTVTMYDVFTYLNGSDIGIESLAWTNDTTRATALTAQDGIYVKSGDASRRYFGSFRTTSVSGQTELSKDKMFIWNYYNRLPIEFFKNDTTNTWTNAGNGTWSAMNSGNVAWKFEFIRGVNEDPITAHAAICSKNSSSGVGVPLSAIAIDSSSSISLSKTTYCVENYSASFTNGCDFKDYPTAGYHYLQAVQTTNDGSSGTWFGDNGAAIGGGAIAFNQGFFPKTFY